jgi:hypothetical protein
VLEEQRGHAIARAPVVDNGFHNTIVTYFDGPATGGVGPGRPAVLAATTSARLVSPA